MEQDSPPSFSQTFSREQGILYDSYCYNRALATDVSYFKSNIQFNIGSSCKHSGKISSYASISTYNDILGASANFSKVAIESVNLNIHIPKYYFKTKDSNTQSSKYIKPELHVAIYPPNLDDVNLSLSYILSVFKAKIKASKNEITTKAIFGSSTIGGGCKIHYNISDFMINNIESLAWYKKDYLNFGIHYDFKYSRPLENVMSLYFLRKMFNRIDFVAQITKTPERITEVCVGNEFIYDKHTIIKSKISSDGFLAIGFWAKILPRTSMTVSAKVDFLNPALSKFGVEFNINASPKWKT